MSKSNSSFSEFVKGLWRENPVLVLLLGMCPTLAVTTSVINGLGMGLCTTAVLLGSNVVISLLRNIIPPKVRIPIFIVIIASFVTIVGMLMEGFSYPLYKALGLFIPLIVVNCIILGRAEAFASRRGVIPSFLDGLGMGLGFTFALGLIGSVRELLGAGSWLGYQIMPESYQPILVLVLAPGAFFTLGFLLAAMNVLNGLKKAKK